MANPKRNTCVDCGLPTSGERCKLHANQEAMTRRLATQKKNWEAFNAAGRPGKRGRIGFKHTEEWKRAASERMRKRGLHPSFVEWQHKKKCGPLALNWKGGRTITFQGYVRIRIDGKYVLEHRHVMEKMLGRPLLASEQVHHKDADRQNNAPENLELRSGAHGSGATKHCPTCTCSDHRT